MSSLLGDFPEPPSRKDWRWLGYFFIGFFFSVGPAFILYVFIVAGHTVSTDRAWHLPVLAWFACSAWTAHMGMTGRLMIPNRLFSALVCLGYIFFAYSRGDEFAYRASMNLFIPFLCIWFGNLMGGYSGYAMSHPIDEITPGVIITFGGWLFIIGVPILTIILRHQLG